MGVANKELPYTDQDVLQLDLMMSEVWGIAKRLELELKLIHAARNGDPFDAISDSVSLIDLEQRILRCNLASTRLFKRGFDGILGKHCWELVQGTDHPIEDVPCCGPAGAAKQKASLCLKANAGCSHGGSVTERTGNGDRAVHIVQTIRAGCAEQSMRDLLAMLEAVQNELYVFRPDPCSLSMLTATAQHNLGYSEEQLLQMTPWTLSRSATGVCTINGTTHIR